MTDIKSVLSDVTDRQKWAARGASFVAKAKATKVVWFPPTPAEPARKAAAKAGSTGRNASKKAAKKTSRAGTKASGTARKAASAAKK